MAKKPLVPCFNLARTPSTLQQWIQPEDIFNRYYAPPKRTLCQRTVYLTILTLRALLRSTPYTVRWLTYDPYGISTHIYLVNTREEWEIELAEIVCTNNRTLVRGVRMTPSPLIISTREFDGLEGLQNLLVSTALFAKRPWTRHFELPIVGGNDTDELRKLLKRSVDDDGQVGASFIGTISLPLHVAELDRYTSLRERFLSLIVSSI